MSTKCASPNPLATLLTSSALGGLSGAVGGALGGGPGHRLSGAAAGALAGVPSGLGGGFAGLTGANTMGGPMGPSQGTALRSGAFGSVAGGGVGGFAAGRAVRSMKEGCSPIKLAFELGQQKALEDMGYSSIEMVIKEAQELGLHQTKTAGPDMNALAELRIRLR